MAHPAIADIVAQLQHPDLQTRINAAEELTGLTTYGWLAEIGMAVDDGMAVLRAATQMDWPEPEDEWTDPLPAQLLGALSLVPHAEYTPLLLDHYPKLDANCRWQALQLLAHMPQQEAAEAWVRWYRDIRHTSTRTVPPFGNWARDGMHAEVVLPALIEFAETSDTRLSDEIYHHITKYLERGARSPALAENVIRDYEQLLKVIERVESRKNPALRWESEYWPTRYKAARLLGLMGHLRPDVVRKTLAAALAHTDPRLKAAAAVALIQLGEAVRTPVLESIAGCNETRLSLHEDLRRLKKARLFPRRFATQPAFAEADMVEWLIADIDVPPDEIALLAAVETNEGRYYVFRFMYRPPHPAARDGWMAGVSGPWPPKGLERLSVCGGTTFSRFEPAESLTPEDHVVRHLSM